MDMVSPKYYLHESSALSPLTSSPSTLSGKPLHSSSHTSFPIISVAIIGILATGFLLVSYYIFVIKCCLNWHRIDILRRFSFSRRRRVEDPSMAYSSAAEKRGLDEALIRAIPIFHYKKGAGKDEHGERSLAECAVCLNEFQEDEKLRSIPICGHMFHIDCIDVWLQNNANCPLCRNSISISSTIRFPVDDHVRAPSSSPQIQNSHSDSFMHGDEDYVVIEIGEQNRTNQTLLRVQEGLNSGDQLAAQQQPITSPSPRKLQPKMLHKKAKKFSHVSSMGDECIDIRHKDEQFGVQQPIRRSFSMDSAADRQLYLAVQEIVQRHKQLADVSTSEGCSNIVKRSFFSFGHGRGSRNAVLPVHMEL